ncbi:MAG TPA: DUF134 domain-containing protein [Epulopiscium sp.]|nr:DUF134 domain-containing protein [Candidatus Epulonipiscium sp.]
MARPIKWRKVCSLPESNRFGPLGLERDPSQFVTMTVDEYETIRLIDLEGFNQEECAKQMGVARTTVQGIYAEARKKLAISLVEGKTLMIQGGEYEICDGRKNGCGRGCRRRMYAMKETKQETKMEE